MLQSPVLRRLYSNLQQGQKAFDDLPDSSSPGIMDSYRISNPANVPNKQVAPPPAMALPAFQQPVPQEAPKPQPVLNSPQPAPPQQAPPPPQEVKLDEDAAPVKEEKPKTNLPGLGLDSSFSTGPVKGFGQQAEGWEKNRIANTAGGYGNYNMGGYTKNVAGGYSGFGY